MASDCQMNRCLEEVDVPEYTTKGKSTLVGNKIFSKRNRPKQLQTYNVPIIREAVYNSLIRCELFFKELKGCCKPTREIGDRLLIVHLILLERKMSRKSRAMAWIDYKKAKIYPAMLDNS